LSRLIGGKRLIDDDTVKDAGAVSAGVARRSGSRGPLPRFTREQIFDAALRIIDAHGREALTMRRLAEELGTGTTTLYVYVKTKEELLEGVETVLLGRLVTDLDEQAPWEEQLTGALRRLRDVQRAHPAFVDVLTAQVVPGPTLDMVRERLLGIFRRAGFSKQQAAHSLGAVVAYVLGFGVSERARARGVSEARRLAGLSTGDYPNLTEMAAEWGEHDPDRDFEYGLAHLIDGLKRDLNVHK
jgi:TetR/AcrR family transcriptional regulator, tetracycline repressor protein